MEREKIIFLRNFFFRAFVVGVLFAVFYWIVTLALWHAYTPWLMEQFKMDEKELGALTLNFFANVRIVIVFFFLVPALALHWNAKKA
ncbi:MAG TPA: hypothetical protein VE867_02090 [Candidatus Binatia bacterium]|jgi:hypothetical protein|nr:hypothetical protein [Candidatus Binatia bacterium]